MELTLEYTRFALKNVYKVNLTPLEYNLYLAWPRQSSELGHESESECDTVCL